MKNIMKQTLLITPLLFLVACSTSSKSYPSQNKELSKYTSGIQKSGGMQKSLDKWLKDEWEPVVNKDKEIQKKYPKTEKNSVKKSERSFSLQEYVDKAMVYRESVPDSNNSHTKKIESLPVIGK